MKPTPTPAPDVARGFEESIYEFSGHIQWQSYIYLAFAVIDTFLTCAGMLWLFMLRNNPAIRIRRHWALQLAISCLTAYLILVYLQFPLRWWYSCEAEYFVMGFLLQFGIGMMISFIDPSLRRKKSTASKTPLLKRPWQWIKERDYESTTLVVLIIALIVTTIVVITVYVGSRNFHEGSGWFGEWSGVHNCYRGGHGEWAITALMLMFWIYLYGPFTLYNIWNIKDSHKWAIQTKISIMSNFFGIPIWLVFLYSNNPGILAVNRYWSHALWLALGLIVTKYCFICFPIYDACRGMPYFSSQTERNPSTASWTTNSSKEKVRQAYSIGALDECLEKNIEQLLEWSARRDFSAENIAFLRAVRDMKSKSRTRAVDRGGVITHLIFRERYEEAAIIFFKFIDPRTADIPLNISKRTVDGLRQWFKYVSYDSLDDDSSSKNDVAPFIDFNGDFPSASPNGEDIVIDRLYPMPLTEIVPTGAIDDEGNTADTVPEGFNLDIFDDVYAQIRHLVYTNSWRRFVVSCEGDVESFTSSLQTAATKQTGDSMGKELYKMPSSPTPVYRQDSPTSPRSPKQPETPNNHEFPRQQESP
ncbi:uncharacterized protein K452DRAFT_311865 [Aplosporella prunicola CBS 121167]|uniref:RGS domain-containing protein n=1 Tax=Aplosporella prunicola CBS 121167 TaxID=1176127 RepID=A0A6A6B3A7_9PEZI|nr:uncharacterized protein K452DRAFT_311865 [Aplosporella prunicola CBS 121167]KAF2138088.1 hypothetical protein K452DRAFT_311865 [Aplosporella prunicola CBS 121167]